MVPQGLFDNKKETPEGILFAHQDCMLSLLFLSIPASEKSHDALWRSLSAESGVKQFIHERRFASRFVVTGVHPWRA